MTNSEKLFLLLAKELSFSHAAEKAFISQQCLSDHIKRLEESYGTKLFIRKPNVKLTNAGEMVLKTLLTVNRIENGLKTGLAEIENGQAGILRLSTNCARAKVLIPALFAQYNQVYPHVQLELIVEETVAMQELLRAGKIDCFLGVNGEYDSSMQSVPLSTEGFYLMASAAYLKKHAGINTDQLINMESKIDLHCFQGLPFILNHAMSTAHPLLHQFLSAQDITVRNVFCTSEYDVAEQICRNGQAAFFCPQLLVASIIDKNSFYPMMHRLYAFPIQELSNAIHFSLVYDGLRHYPRYSWDFFKMIPDVVRQCLA